MGHKLNLDLDLTDEQYEALTGEAEESRQEIKAVIGELVDELRTRRIRYTKRNPRSPAQQAVSEALYKAGITSSMPTGESFSDEEEAELKRLADLFGHAGGKPASEMVIEDRGPY